MVNSMKSINVIQEVKILPRAKANHQPGSETCWQEETNVRSQVDQVDRLCIELRNRTYIVVQNVRLRADKGINTKATPELLKCEPRTVSTCWNATSKVTLKVSRLGGHRSRRPAAYRSRDDTGNSREPHRFLLFANADHQWSNPPWESTAKPKLPLERPPPPGRSAP